MATLHGRRKERPRIETPNPVDVHVGSRLRLRRTLLGMSQQRLAAAIGLTFQQVQKYERGANRISAGRLLEMADALEVPVSFFFDQLQAAEPSAGPITAISATLSIGIPHKRETLELARAYHGITDAVLRKRLYELIKSMGPVES